MLKGLKQSWKASALLSRGVQHLEGDELEEALPCLRDCVVLAPKNQDAWFQLGNVLQRLGEHREAIVCFTRALWISKSNLDNFVNRGLSHHELGDDKSAMQDFNRAIELNPRYSLSYNNRGILHERQGNLDLARKDFSKAVNIDPYFFPAWGNLARIEAKNGRIEEALNATRRSVQLDCDDIETVVTLGFHLIETGDCQVAIEIVDEILAVQPHHVDALACRGYAWYTRGNAVLALADLYRAHQIEPRSDLATQLLCFALADSNQPTTVVELLGDLPAEIRNEPTILALLALAKMSLSDGLDAVRELEAAVCDAGDAYEVYLCWATGLYNLGDLKSAMAACERAVQMGAAPSQVGHLRGLFHYHLGSNRKALRYLRADDSPGVLARHNLSFQAELLSLEGDVDAAIAMANRVLKLIEGSTGVFTAIEETGAHFVLRDYPRAKQVVDVALAAGVQCEFTRVGLLLDRARAHHRLGDMESANLDISAAIELRPEYAKFILPTYASMI